MLLPAWQTVLALSSFRICPVSFRRVLFTFLLPFLLVPNLPVGCWFFFALFLCIVFVAVVWTVWVEMVWCGLVVCAKTGYAGADQGEKMS